MYKVWLGRNVAVMVPDNVWITVFVGIRISEVLRVVHRGSQATLLVQCTSLVYGLRWGKIVEMKLRVQFPVEIWLRDTVGILLRVLNTAGILFGVSILIWDSERVTVTAEIVEVLLNYLIHRFCYFYLIGLVIE